LATAAFTLVLEALSRARAADAVADEAKVAAAETVIVDPLKARY